MEFFGCEQGKGVLLPTDEGDGSFLVAGGAKVSLYLPPREQGVFWRFWLWLRAQSALWIKKEGEPSLLAGH